MAKGKMSAKAKADDIFDKRMGIKEGGKKDNKIDKMVGVPIMKGKKK